MPSLVGHRYGWVPSASEGGDGERNVARLPPRMWPPFLISSDPGEIAARAGATDVDEASLTFSLTLNTEVL